jgi:hypothetical protein
VKSRYGEVVEYDVQSFGATVPLPVGSSKPGFRIRFAAALTGDGDAGSNVNMVARRTIAARIRKELLFISRHLFSFLSLYCRLPLIHKHNSA